MEKLAENRFLQLLKYKNGQQLYDKKNKNTKKREHFMYFLNIICILVV